MTRRTETPEAFARRLAVWHHNGFLGRVEMAKQSMKVILQAPTPTPEAKALAVEIEGLLELLYSALKTRSPL